MTTAGDDAPRVIVVGGGLAGLAAAAALAERGLRVELHEARRRLGGRASSWRDPNSGELVDFCQHVGMACCTNRLDFCRRAGLLDALRRDRVIHFFSADGRSFRLQAARWLPAPMHLLPSLLRLGYLSWRERLGICRAMLRLMRLRSDDDSTTAGEWLRRQGQSSGAIAKFWEPVLVSALGESIDRASLRYARKVFVDGFLAHRNAYEIDVPTVPLGELYGEKLLTRLRRLGVQVWTESAVREVALVGESSIVVRTASGLDRTAEAVVVALPWRKAGELLAPLVDRFPEVAKWREFGAAPISGVHLWFDRRITELQHAVLVGTLAQWVFRSVDATRAEHYYQVVVSASYDLEALDKSAAVERIVGELRRVFTTAVDAKLLRWKIVTEPEAVFSARPGIDDLRPGQATPIPRLFLAGDWTATGWPSTMEGAVRSGYLAAEAVLQSLGRPERIVIDDLPRSPVTRLLIRR